MINEKEKQEYARLNEDLKEKLINWICNGFAARRTLNKRHSSYGLKHKFSAQTREDIKGTPLYDKLGDCYVTNGQFKGAMEECGYIGTPYTNNLDGGTNDNYSISQNSPVFKKVENRYI